MVNEEQIITGYPLDGAIGSLGEGRVRKSSVVCLHNNAIVARGILVKKLHYGTTESRLSAIYIVSSVGDSLSSGTHVLPSTCSLVQNMRMPGHITTRKIKCCYITSMCVWNALVVSVSASCAKPHHKNDTILHFKRLGSRHIHKIKRT